MAELLRDGGLDTLLIFDIDQFRRLNTDLGYKTGDQVLALVHRVVSEERGRGYRIGGDRFGMLGAAGEIDAEQLRNTVAMVSARRLGVRVTLSGGALRADGAVLAAPNATVDILYAAAPQLLTLAKQLGRDRVLWLANEDEATPDVLRVATRMYRQLAEANADRSRRMETESRIDALTGLHNRRGFDDVFGRTAEASQRQGTPLALIYMDSDSLKQIRSSRSTTRADTRRVIASSWIWPASSARVCAAPTMSSGGELTSSPLFSSTRMHPAPCPWPSAYVRPSQSEPRARCPSVSTPVFRRVPTRPSG